MKDYTYPDIYEGMWNQYFYGYRHGDTVVYKRKYYRVLGPSATPDHLWVWRDYENCRIPVKECRKTDRKAWRFPNEQW